ncbi:hypothetical protein Tco_0136916, partial [Tanacetum coccineum]
MAKLRETDRGRQAHLTEALRLVRDMRREMGDMQTELLSQQEQLRRERQPGPDAILPDHQEATGDSEGDGRHADRVAIPARAVEERETARTECYTPRSPGGYWGLGGSHLAV